MYFIGNDLPVMTLATDRVTFPVQGVPVPQDDTVIVTNANQTGNYQQYWPNLSLEFAFYGASNTPIAPAVIFTNSTNGEMWFYAFSYPTASIGTWTMG